MLMFLLATSLSTLTSSGYPIEPVGLKDVRLRDAFWAPRIERNAKVTISHELDECEQTGRIDNFRAAAGDPGAKYSGLVFDDSDVYKVIEAASYSLEIYPDPVIEKRVDGFIDVIARAQEADGYLHTPQEARARGQQTPVRTADHWVNEDWDHELYCAGHMYEGAVAYAAATGKTKFLKIAIKNADLVCRTFNPGGDLNVSGHEEIEIGLVKLYHATGNRKYLDEAKWLIDQRGKPDGRRRLMGDYAQDDRPVVDQQHAEGHSVRACYLYMGMSDVAAATSAPGYRNALDRFWNDVADSMIYVTGGIGSTGANEGFTMGYDLPNMTAYCETCASVANAMWNQRMFQAEGDSKYIDVAERTLYNAFLSGVGEDGKTFFYPNVLLSMRGARRSPWFECACCPPNEARLLPTVATWLYGKAKDRLYVNYYAANDLHTQLDGARLGVSEDTNYPWDGKVTLTMKPSRRSTFDLALRIPGWAVGHPLATSLYTCGSMPSQPVTLSLNGRPMMVRPNAHGYVVIRRAWRAGDRVQLDLPMPVLRLSANQRVKADHDRVAIQRGPIVFCGEGVDQNGHLLDLMLPKDARFSADYRTDILGGVETLTTEGILVSRGVDRQPVATDEREKLTLIPYCSWANRGRSPMTVWLPTAPSAAFPAPAPTLARTSTVTTSGGTGIYALTDQFLPSSSIDHTYPYFHWWPRKGTREWVEMALAQPSDVSTVRIYWFQDEGMGECRLPKAWRVLSWQSGAWKPVTTTTDYEIAKDRFCSVSFDPVHTSRIRIEVDLPDRFSTGIHEIELQ